VEYGIVERGEPLVTAGAAGPRSTVHDPVRDNGATTEYDSPDAEIVTTTMDKVINIVTNYGAFGPQVSGRPNV